MAPGRATGLGLHRAKYNQARLEDPAAAKADFMKEVPSRFAALDAWAEEPTGGGERARTW